MARVVPTPDPTALVRLLTLRPDLVQRPVPRNVDELDARLDDPIGAYAAMQSATVPVVQVTQALAGLGGRASLTALAELLGVQRAAYEPMVEWLADRGLLGAEDDELVLNRGLRQVVGDPLQLGPPLHLVLDAQTVTTLRAVLEKLDQPRVARKADAVDAVATLVGDAEWVAEQVSTAPARVREWLMLHASGDGHDSFDYSAAAFQAQQAAVRWATERGLVYADSMGAGYVSSMRFLMPREVTLALRGSGHHAPFDAEPPTTEGTPVDPVILERATASAASAFSAAAVAILDRLSRAGVKPLRAGGLGAREITKLSRATGADDTLVRLVLELADRLELLDHTGELIRASPEWAAWREQEPADRYVDLVRTWWALTDIPTLDRVDGRPKPVMIDADDCDQCRAGRHVLVATVADAPGAVTLAQAGSAALWRRPLVHPDLTEDRVPFELTWRETELIGVLAAGDLAGSGALTVTRLGRALLADDDDELRTSAASVLPATTSEALFGADLTAVAPGAPSAALTSLLDGCADRESGGGAVTWRFSPGSIRRALDDGVPGPTLLESLRGAARDTLPQTLEYLVNDIARRHGSLRVGPATSVIRGDDEALLVQACADRSLRRLRLTKLAPTVLASDAPAEETLKALRGAGYLPVPDGGVVPTPPPTPARRSRAGTGRPTSHGAAPDFEAIARKILNGTR